ncbi:Cobalt-precorrin-6y C5-methyltransferase / Cobalt-precorrin-6y C15-methyltransferase [decarboxylating] [invertebrate metagenome]|uniref:Cobalt-precorrin-6y C5-methyltransferase / Cobalt-precorrin-6y C15-methyltransferase [decarboxylating] n=1 Tax=invertebrate metagenome TaxID=1711999 RepID=A0A484H697_9ZZZZ
MATESRHSLVSPWLTVVGVGEDGADGLSPAARAFISTASTVLGSTRHLEQVAAILPMSAEILLWTGLTRTLTTIKARRGQQLVVLASGDPMLYGLGATLAHHFSTAEMLIVPHISAFSLAAARLGWPLQEVETLTVHGRPLESLILYIASGVRLLVLSADGETPGHAAALLTAHGFGPSRMTVLEHIGGPAERHVSGYADRWQQPRTADLNVLAIECRATAGFRGWGRGAGLPDEAYRHDGQLTKREIRAVTLAALAPGPGELLWDIGAGAGSISIEWLRTHPSTIAVAVEQDAARVTDIAMNATRLGVPDLQIVHNNAPDCLPYLPGPPAAVFVGGSVSAPGMLETCWEALRGEGRLVVNAVTIEAEARLLAWHSQHGGTLVRLSVARLRPIGQLSAWNPLAPVMQYQGWKPA